MFMVEKGRRPADVIQITQRPRAPGGSPLVDGPGKAVAILAHEVEHSEALAAISSLGVMSVRASALAELGAPGKLKLSRIDGGYEVYDTSSSRHAPFSRAESSFDWVRSFYLAVFEDGGLLMCRYLNREPGRRVLGALEQPVFDPRSRAGKYSMDSFIESVLFGDPPD